MDFGYIHEKMSLALFSMCSSRQNLKGRLRGFLLSSTLLAFPEELFPETLRQQFSEIKTAVPGELRLHSSRGLDAIDRMRPLELRRLLNNIIDLREGVAEEYNKRKYQHTLGTSAAPAKDTLAAVAKKLLSAKMKPSPHS